MTVDDPSSRPTAAEAFKSIQEYHEGFTRAQLGGPVPKPNLQTMTFSEIFRRMDEANARQAARGKKQLEAELVQSIGPSS